MPAENFALLGSEEPANRSFSLKSTVSGMLIRSRTPARLWPTQRIERPEPRAAGHLLTSRLVVVHATARV